MEPKVCIGIPFTVWNDLVKESVQGCLNLDYSNFSVVLVPNENAKIPDEFLKNKRIIVASTKTSSIPVKRNQGWKTCRGDFYACLDSDSYPEKNWLKEAVLVFQKSPDIWAVGGPNISPWYKDLKKQAVANALKSFLVGGPRVFVKRLSPDRYVYDLQTCNLVIKMSTIDAIGGFDENFATAEDTEFCGRIIKAEKKIYFSKDVLVHHHNRSLFLQFLKQKIVFGYAATPPLKKDFRLSRIFVLLPFFFLVWALAGWTVFLLHQFFLYLWFVSMALYLAAILEEAIKWSSSWKEIPLTCIAILIGNIAPGIGTLLYLLGVRLNFPAFYVNFKPTDKAVVKQAG